MNMTGFNGETPNYEDMNLEQLADLRAWQLERLEMVSQALRDRVRTEYAPGDNIKRLAKKIGVTRATVYSWVK